MSACLLAALMTASEAAAQVGMIIVTRDLAVARGSGLHSSNSRSTGAAMALKLRGEKD